MGMTVEVSIDEKRLVREYMRHQGIKGLLELVREVAEQDAIPEGCPDATAESNRCYFALNGIDETIMDLEKMV